MALFVRKTESFGNHDDYGLLISMGQIDDSHTVSYPALLLFEIGC